MIQLTGGALKHGLYLAKNLQIDAAAMRANIARARDLILAEAAVFALVRALPRPKAEALVKKACAQAVAENKSLIEVVHQLAKTEGAEDAVDWQALGQPEHYLGESSKMIDRVLERAKKICA
jgi:3-carboxy-cis,cis-muconate cycloisomerase